MQKRVSNWNDPDLPPEWIRVFGSEMELTQLVGRLIPAMEFESGCCWLHTNRVRPDYGGNDDLQTAATSPAAEELRLDPNEYLPLFNGEQLKTHAPDLAKAFDKLDLENDFRLNGPWLERWEYHWLRKEFYKREYACHTHMVTLHARQIIGDAHQLIVTLSTAFPELLFVYELWGNKYLQIVCKNGSVRTIHHTYRELGWDTYVEDGVTFMPPKQVAEFCGDFIYPEVEHVEFGDPPRPYNSQGTETGDVDR
jgi:hypothetical protein